MSENKRSVMAPPMPATAFCHVLRDNVPQPCHRHVLFKAASIQPVSFDGSTTCFLQDASVGSSDINNDDVINNVSLTSSSPFPTIATASSSNDHEFDASDPSMLFELMSPNASIKPEQMSTSSLAYLGDVVYELFIRSRYVWPSRRMSDLQDKVVSIVRAEAQSLLLQKFVNSFPLTPIEQNVLARGRNANLSARKKNSGGHVSAFQESTAFEALIGYTYITNNNRLEEMLHWIKLELDRLDEME